MVYASFRKILSSILIIAMLFTSVNTIHFTKAQNLAERQPVPSIFIPAAHGLQVNALRGNLIYSPAGLSVSGRGPSLDVRLIYNSQLASRDTGYGYGWQMNYNIYYSFSGNDILIHHGNGRIDTYRWDGRNFISPPGLSDRLIEYELNRYQLELEDGSILYFASPAHRFVTTIVDRHGNQIEFAYENARLDTITDDSGRAFNFDYDSEGYLIAVSDDSRSIAMTYDAVDLTQIIDANGNETRFAYDDEHLMTSLIDPQGNATEISFENARVIAIDSSLNLQEFDYDTMNHSTTVISGERRTTYNFDSFNRLISIVDASGAETRMGWDANNNLLSVTNANDNSVEYEYDEAGNRISETDASGNVTQYRYNENNRLLSVEDALGQESTFSYDEQNNLIAILDPTGAETRFIYAENGDLVELVDANENSVTLEYDDSGNLSRITNPLGKATEFTFDSIGYLVAVTDANDNTSEFDNDTLGQLLNLRNALNQELSFEYDANGNLIAVENSSGQRTSYNYDALNRLVMVIDADGNETNYRYDEAGNLLSITDANGNVTHYEYDLIGQVTAEIDPAGNHIEYAYDAVGNLVEQTDAEGNTTVYRYDAVNRLVEITYADETAVTYEYDAVGQRIAMTDSIGTTEYEYDAVGRLTRVIDANGHEIGYSYDAAGQITELEYPDGSIVSYEYDAAGNLIAVSDDIGTTTYDYDPAGRPVARTYPNGVTSEYTYDDANNLLSIMHFDPDDNILLGFEYSLNDTGLRTEMVRISGNGNLRETTSYTYDALDRLTEVVYPNESFEIYTYDAVGNRLSLETDAGTINYEYDDANRLLLESAPDGDISFTHDANGNLIERATPDHTWLYSYDMAGRLVQVEPPDDVINYQYDGDGMRLGKSNGEDQVEFVNHISGLLPTVIFEYYSDTERTYTIGLDHISNSDTGYFLEDGLNSIVGLADENGILSNEFSYNSFGSPAQVAESSLPFGYTGEIFDSESDLLYLRTRYYLPDDGRFLSSDTFPGFLIAPQSIVNTYAYVDNNPINFVDPTGQIAFIPILGWYVGSIIAGAIISGVTTGVSDGIAEGISGGTSEDVGSAIADGFYNGLIPQDTLSIGVALIPGSTAFKTVRHVGRYTPSFQSELRIAIGSQLSPYNLRGLTNEINESTFRRISTQIYPEVVYGDGAERIYNYVTQPDNNVSQQPGTNVENPLESDVNELAQSTYDVVIIGDDVLLLDLGTIIDRSTYDLDVACTTTLNYDGDYNACINDVLQQCDPTGAGIDTGCMLDLTGFSGDAPVIISGFATSEVEPGHIFGQIQFRDPNGDAVRLETQLISTNADVYNVPFEDVITTPASLQPTGGIVTKDWYCSGTPGVVLTATLRASVVDRAGNRSQWVEFTLADCTIPQR